MQVWLAPLPIHSCVGAIANRGQWEQGCSLFMTTDLGPVRATRNKKKKKKKILEVLLRSWNLCLGLIHKEDYVRSILLSHQMDILNLQEIPSNMDPNLQVCMYLHEHCVIYV